MLALGFFIDGAVTIGSSEPGEFTQLLQTSNRQETARPQTVSEFALAAPRLSTDTLSKFFRARRLARPKRQAVQKFKTVQKALKVQKQ